MDGIWNTEYQILVDGRHGRELWRGNGPELHQAWARLCSEYDPNRLDAYRLDAINGRMNVTRHVERARLELDGPKLSRSQRAAGLALLIGIAYTVWRFGLAGLALGIGALPLLVKWHERRTEKYLRLRYRYHLFVHGRREWASTDAHAVFARAARDWSSADEIDQGRIFIEDARTGERLSLKTAEAVGWEQV